MSSSRRKRSRVALLIEEATECRLPPRLAASATSANVVFRDDRSARRAGQVGQTRGTREPNHRATERLSQQACSSPPAPRQNGLPGIVLAIDDPDQYPFCSRSFKAEDGTPAYMCHTQTRSHCRYGQTVYLSGIPTTCSNHDESRTPTEVGLCN